MTLLARRNLRELLTVVPAALALVFAACSPPGPDPRATATARLFAEWNSLESPGCAVGVIQNDAFLLRRYYGLADLTRHVPIGPDTVFSLASLSKQFTATAIGLLVVREKISLDDDVRKYIPELPEYGEPVLIRDLIYHTSGIRDYISMSEDLSDFGRLDRPHTQGDFLSLLARQKALNFPPGTQFSYNNSNYFLLGIVVKRVTGTSLREFAEKEIFQPLGMKNTRFEDDYREVVHNRAIGYEPSGNNGFSVVRSYFDQVGDGGVQTTLNDFALWDREFYRSVLGGQDLHRLLMTTGKLRDGTKLNYTFGLYIDPSPVGPRIYHGGNDAGFRTRLLRYPAQHFSIVCLCNLSSVSTNPLAERIADIYLGGSSAERVTEVPVPAQKVRELEGFYRDPSTSGIWSFQAKGDRLIGNLVGVPGERRLMPTGPEDFSTAEGSFKARFDVAHQTVQISEYGAPATVFSRVKLAAPANLGDYAGAYFSSELDTTYEFAVRKGQLTVLSPRAAAAPLSPTVADSFTGFGNYFSFERSKEGAIVGLRLGENTGRVRNLEFTKIQNK